MKAVPIVRRNIVFFAAVVLSLPAFGQEVDLARGLIGHWPTIAQPREIAAAESPRLGTGEFSIALWAKSAEVSDHSPGDLISKYDPLTHRGFHLTLKTNAGVTSNQANWRHLQFGIDNDWASPWRDCGRPGESLFAFALATHAGQLYAGTCEPGKGQSGRVYRYAGGQQWVNCGAPDGSNSVTALAAHEGKLYAGTGKYRLAGSALPESENSTLGGRVFRYDGDSRWTACGQLPHTEAVGGLVVFRGKLYASSLYLPPGLFRYEGDQNWTELPVPQGPDRQTGALGSRRVSSLTVFEGFLYASSYDGGRVYRFDGQEWTDCGQLGDNTQTYAFAPYQGRLHVATWPSGRVYRFDGIHRWADTGRLGEELEVMGMVVHNGRFIAGTLPLAEVYAYERDGLWQRLERLDQTADVKYRRAWTMAEHAGELFCSTLPSGKIYAFSAGKQTQWGHTLSSAWHPIAAVRSASRLTLYVDGKRVAQSPEFHASEFALDSVAPLQLGAGTNGAFRGQIVDLRLYQRALSDGEIEFLSQNQPQMNAPR